VNRPFAEFHNALYGAAPAGAFVELRIARPRGGMEQRFFDVRDVAGVEQAVAEAGPKTDVYIGVNARTRCEGKRSAIECCHVLHGDVDGDRAKLRAFRPLPSIVVASGSGLHAYWALVEAIGPDEAEAANRQLATAVDGDMRSTDAARILRPPGSFNHKGAEPRPVEMLRCKAEIFTVASVVGQLPEPSEPPRQERPPRAEFAAGEDALLTIPPAVYVVALTGRQVGRDGKVCCPFHDDKTPSMHVYETPEKGVHCFGCGRGSGTIYDFASELSGIGTRGADFKRLQTWIAQRILNTPVSI
jgi:hypothetical protein